MKAYRLTLAAEDDLFKIWSYIARDDVTSADRLEAECYFGHLPRVGSQGG